MDKVTIIAEAGVNHNGDLNQAKSLIDAASDSGADYVKFQTFKADRLVSKHAEKAEYQKQHTSQYESHYEMIQKLELSFDDHLHLINYCDFKKIKFLSSPFDIESIKLLIKLKLDTLKIPSSEITNLPYLRFIGSQGIPLILSTGMSTMDEVSFALDILLNSGLSKDNLSILHCNTEYPTPMYDVNLNAMVSMKKKLGVKIGYSDHTLGIEVPIASVALGASIIEKHLTLDRNLQGPDHNASLEPDELKRMIKSIRNIEQAMGSKVKKPSSSEKKNIPIARKSIVASRSIKKSEFFTKKNITIKRPGTGISPLKWDEIIGLQSIRDFQIDDLIKI
tara:strand:+ start:270 stop:1274 length:1005 start_codon:yes stop_codon:yes gene_type:complete